MNAHTQHEAQAQANTHAQAHADALAATYPQPERHHMKTGELTGQATLFLRANIYRQRTSAGDEQLLFSLVERRGRGVQLVTALWAGPAAESFFKLCGAACKPGKAIAFTFSRITVHNGELLCIVHTATLAPDRWGTESPGAGNNTGSTGSAAH